MVSSEGRLVGVMPNSEMLGVVEDMARRLLTEEEVAAVMKACRRVRSFVHSCRQTETFVFTAFITQFLHNIFQIFQLY